MAIAYVYIVASTNTVMKTYVGFCFLGILSLHFSCYAQGEMPVDDGCQGRKPVHFYLSMEGIMAVPVAPLKTYSDVRGGVRFALGGPLKASSPFSVGLELGGIFSGSKKDKFKGLDVKTSTTMVELQPVLRYIPKMKHALDPYFEFTIGIMAASTITTSEIVDEPTFLEEVLFGSETQVETTTHQRGGSTNLSYGLGAGVIINDCVTVGVRYQHANPVDYIDFNNVSVNNGAIQYEVNRIPLDMIQITIGIGIWRMP